MSDCIHVTLVTPGGTVLVENYKLGKDDTFNDLLDLGMAKVPYDPHSVLRFQLLSPKGEQFRRDASVASNVSDGDTLTFVIVSRDPRAHEWVAKVRAEPDKLKCAPEFARSDPLVALEAVQRYGLALSYAVPSLRADKEVVSAAVSRDGRSLQFASPELRDDKDVALAAVLHHGRALEFASERLRGDFEMVLYACTNEGNSLEFATPEWRRNEKMVLLAVQRPYLQICDGRPSAHRNMLPIQFAAEELRSDFDFMWQAVQMDTRCADYAAESIRRSLQVRIDEENLEKNRWFTVEEFRARYPDLLPEDTAEIQSVSDQTIHCGFCRVS